MLTIQDSLDAILIGCFLFGLVFTGLTLFLGGLDFGHGADSGHDAGHDHAGHDHSWLGILNVNAILAFLTWFGGVGYLARNAFGWLTVFALGVGVLGGLAGGYVVNGIIRRIMQSEDRPLDPEDYRLPGIIARVSSSIRTNGVGEIIYEQAGRRQVAAAKADSDRAIPRGTEVVVLRAANGMTIVEPLEALIDGGEEHPASRDRTEERIIPTS
jgi:membrane protein implicated in regulation of membrane protease activity